MAAITYAAFLERFPEFSKAPQSLVESKIEEAETVVTEKVFADRYQVALGYFAAHLLAVSVFGQQMRLVGTDGITPYERMFMKLRAAVHKRVLVVV